VRDPEEGDGIPGSDSSDPDIRNQAVWEKTPEGDKALTREKQRILEGLKPKNVTRAGWEDD
jgi:hypothetical protein